MTKYFWLILLFVVITLIGICYWKIWQNRIATAIYVDELSPRAKEFISNQRSSGASYWNTVTLPSDNNELIPIKVEKQDTNNSCFSVKFPWEVVMVSETKEEVICRWEGKLVSPLMHIVIGWRPFKDDFNSESGILLRRKNPIVYHESTMDVTGFHAVSIFRDEGGITVFAYSQQDVLVTIGFNQGFNYSTITDEQIKSILTSFTLKLRDTMN